MAGRTEVAELGFCGRNRGGWTGGEALLSSVEVFVHRGWGMAEDAAAAAAAPGGAAAVVVGNKKSGTVKWFNSSKGFGFITPDDGGEDLFVHQTSIHAEGFRSLREGESVEFSVESSDDGRTKALDVTGPGGTFVQGASYRRDGYGGGGGRGGGGRSSGGGLGGASGGYGGGGPVGIRARGGRAPRGGGGFGGGGGGDRSCYNCGEGGHIARDCPNESTGNARQSGGGGGGGTRNCYNCGESGHLARDCTLAANA